MSLHTVFYIKSFQHLVNGTFMSVFPVWHMTEGLRSQKESPDVWLNPSPRRLLGTLSHGP